MTDKWLTCAELADVLGVSKGWVQEQVTAKAIPHHRVGTARRLVRFSPADVKAIEQASAVTPAITRLRSTA